MTDSIHSTRSALLPWDRSLWLQVLYTSGSTPKMQRQRQGTIAVHGKHKDQADHTESCCNCSKHLWGSMLAANKPAPHCHSKNSQCSMAMNHCEPM